MTKSFTYLKVGVSSSKDDIQKIFKNIDQGILETSFCKVVPDIFTNDDEWCMITHADGAGTKSILAYLYFKQTGNTKFFRGIAQDSIVMNLDD